MSKASKQELDTDTAHAIYDLLVSTCRASAHGRESFVYAQTRRHESEWRFMGALGFGGKFWRTHGRRPDGSWGECWLVNQYPEDATDESRAMIVKANNLLWTLQQSSQAEADQ